MIKRTLLSLLFFLPAAGLLAQQTNDSIPYAQTDSIPGVMELEGVEVTARKPVIQTEADRLIYNMEEDASAAASTVLEMMRKVPTLSVDGDDNISFKGGSNFKIYLNGKPDPSLSSDYKEVLRAMPASMVKKIEVITEPGAKYDAEGVGGIINIITFQRTKIEGYRLNFGLTASDTRANEYIYGITKIGNVTANLNISNANSFPPAYHSTMVTDYFDSTLPASRRRYTSSKNRYGNTGGSLQLSWEPNENNLFTLSTSLFNYRSSSYSHSFHSGLDANGDIFDSYTAFTPMNVSTLSTSVQTNWQHNFSSPEQNIVLSYMYAYGRRRNNSTTEYSDLNGYDPADFLNQRNLYSLPTHEHTLQADYTNPFGSHHTLEVGAKGVLRDNYSNADKYLFFDDTWHPDLSDAADLKQFQQIMSAYASYIGKFGIFMVKAGMRYEYTRMGVRFKTAGYTDFTSRFSDPVPSVLLSLRLTEGSHLKFNYGEQIQRPSISQLNPTVDDASKSIISFGNPDLSATHAHTLRLSYSNFAGSVGGEGSIGYTRNLDIIDQYIYLRNDGILVSTYGNVGSSSGVNLFGYIYWRPINILSINLNGGGYYNNFHCPLIEIFTHGWGYYGNLSANLETTTGWGVDAWGGLGNSGVYVQAKGSTYHYYGIGLSKKLMQDRLTISVNFSDFFEPTYKYKYTSEGPGYRISQESKSNNWSFSVGVRLRLGSLSASVKKTASEVSNDDLSSGSGGGGGKK